MTALKYQGSGYWTREMDNFLDYSLGSGGCHRRSVIETPSVGHPGSLSIVRGLLTSSDGGLQPQESGVVTARVTQAPLTWTLPRSAATLLKDFA
jgi:hypothetical protein